MMGSLLERSPGDESTHWLITVCHLPTDGEIIAKIVKKTLQKLIFFPLAVKFDQKINLDPA
jgi:hypothetical protein